MGAPRENKNKGPGRGGKVRVLKVLKIRMIYKIRTKKGNEEVGAGRRGFVNGISIA